MRVICKFETIIAYKYLLIEIDCVTVLLDCIIMCVKIVSFFLNN